MRRIITLILISSLVLSCVAPAYAATTVVKPESSSDGFHKFSWGQSTGSNLSSSTQTVSTWSDMVNLITQSIAYSIKSMSDRNHYDINFISGQLATIIDNTSSGLSSPEFWVQDSTHVGFVPAGDSPSWSSNASYDMNRVTAWYFMHNDGSQFSQVQDGLSIFQQLKFLLVTTNTSVTRGLVRLGYHTAGDYYLYSMEDMSEIELPDDYQTGSLWDTTIRGFSNLSSGLSKLVYVFANPQDIAAKQASSSQVENFTDEYLDPSGDHSASISDFNNVGSIGSQLKDNLSSGASASGSFGAFSNDDGKYNWFSQDTMDQLDTVSSSRVLRSSSSGFTNFVGEHYNEVRRGLDVD